MELKTINIQTQIKDEFEKERMGVVGEMLVPVSQTEFLQMLLDSWRKRK